MPKSDEQDLIAKPKCDLWGQIWLIFHFRPTTAILDFKKYFHRLVSRVKLYLMPIVKLRWTESVYKWTIKNKAQAKARLGF